MRLKNCAIDIFPFFKDEIKKQLCEQQNDSRKLVDTTVVGRCNIKEERRKDVMDKRHGS